MSVAISKKPGHYRFDCKKAMKTKHFQYFLRLGVAMNDLLSVVQLQNLKKSDLPRYTQNGLTIYLLKVQVGHLFECYNAFVQKIQNQRDSESEELINFLRTNSVISPIFAELNEITKHKQFESLRRVRNSLAFHYNYTNNGKDVVNAFETIINGKDGDDPDNGLIVHRGDYTTDRFCFADQTVIQGWLNFAGIDDNDPSLTDKLSDYRKFVFNATSPFIRFAQAAILEWVKLNNLQYAENKVSNLNVLTKKSFHRRRRK